MHINPSMYTPDKIKVRAAFDRAAHDYDSIATFQHQVGERLAAWLTEQPLSLPAAARVLDAGCGTGYGAELLRRHWPQAKFVGCDAAHSMSAHAARRGIATACADIERLPFRDESFDACWSSLALQWCRLLPAFGELHRVLMADGVLAFSTLGPRTLHELDASFAGIDSHRRLLSFPGPDFIEAALMAAGFSEIRLVRENWTTRHPDLKALLTAIRGIGAYQTGGNRRQALMGKNAWRTMASRYEERRGSDGLLPASYDVVLGFAMK